MFVCNKTKPSKSDLFFLFVGVYERCFDLWKFGSLRFIRLRKTETDAERERESDGGGTK